MKVKVSMHKPKGDHAKYIYTTAKKNKNLFNSLESKEKIVFFNASVIFIIDKKELN